MTKSDDIIVLYYRTGEILQPDTWATIKLLEFESKQSKIFVQLRTGQRGRLIVKRNLQDFNNKTATTFQLDAATQVLKIWGPDCLIAHG